VTTTFVLSFEFGSSQSNETHPIVSHQPIILPDDWEINTCIGQTKKRPGQRLAVKTDAVLGGLRLRAGRTRDRFSHCHLHHK
jgi:hypothetical protein